MSCRDVTDTLAERGIDVSQETVRLWGLKLGRVYARRIRKCRPRPDNRPHLDKVLVTKGGKQLYLQQAAESDSDMLGVLCRRRRK